VVAVAAVVAMAGVVAVARARALAGQPPAAVVQVGRMRVVVAPRPIPAIADAVGVAAAKARPVARPEFGLKSRMIRRSGHRVA